MVDLNIGNFVTVGIISIASYAIVKFALNAAKIDAPWL